MGVKEEEFFRRMHEEGIPIDEVHQLLEGVQREQAVEREPKTNQYRFTDERAQRLSDLWFSQRTSANIAQKDKVGLAYISKILGLGDETALLFAQGDRKAYEAVGLIHAGINPYNSDLSGFWEEMQEVFQGSYSQEDIDFLTHESGLEAVFHFQWQLEIPLAEVSPILRRLHENAHVYK